MAAAPEGPKDDKKKVSKDEPEEEEKAADPLATVGDVFSFARTSRVKWHIAFGLFFAVISGCVFPGTYDCCCCTCCST